VQTFSVFKLRIHLLPSITTSVIRILTEIGKFYTLSNKYQEKINVAEEKDKLKRFFNAFSRNLSWFIGMSAYKLIKVKEPEKEQDKKE
jgi:hypothetical protein